MCLILIAFRLEAVRHCRWPDEVLPEAPWVIDEDFLNKYKIDYVAHDEVPYISSGHDDVYGLCKRLGMSFSVLSPLVL
jgi:choline-phosphate cytidylyltransferase